MNICFFAKERLQKIIFMNIKYFLYVLFFNQLHVLLAFFRAAITASGSIVNNSFRDIIMSPEGAVRFCWGRDVGLYRCPRGAEGVSGHIQGGIYADASATEKRQSVAQGCRAALLGNDVGVKCVQGCRRCLRAYS